jgi:hypothetical protein
MDCSVNWHLVGSCMPDFQLLSYSKVREMSGSSVFLQRSFPRHCVYFPTFLFSHVACLLVVTMHDKLFHGQVLCAGWQGGGDWNSMAVGRRRKSCWVLLSISSTWDFIGLYYYAMNLNGLMVPPIKYGWCVPWSTKLNICISTYFLSYPKSPHFPLQRAKRVSASFCLG